jgi:tRNA-splicing ligase RtcB
MNAAINVALANRQILAHLTRQSFAELLPGARLTTLYDVSHNTCKLEKHQWEGRERYLYVHRKGATRALGPGHPAIPQQYRAVGQPVIIGGSMGTGSYVLAGTAESEAKAWSSASHGAGRAMSRKQALKHWRGRELIDELKERGILIRTKSLRGAAEEAPGAYKDVDLVAEATERAGLARRVAFLRPKVCIKG